jgi:hypothetical protein
MPRLAPFGYSRSFMVLTIPFAGFLNATGQVNVCLSKTLPYACELERVEIVTNVVGTGTSANRDLNIRKGSATGTLCGTVAATLANQGVLGVVTAGTVTNAANANKFGVNDTLTVEFQTASAVVFTAGGFDLILTFRDKNQAAA